MKSINVKVVQGRVIIPNVFRKMMKINYDGIVTFQYDEQKGILMIAPCKDARVRCEITGELIEQAEAIPLNKNNESFVSRKGLLKLVDRYIVSVNGQSKEKTTK